MARYLTPLQDCWRLLLVIVPFWTSFLIRTYALKIILGPTATWPLGSGQGSAPFTCSTPQERSAIGLAYNYLPLLHPAGVRLAGADGLDAGRGGHRPWARARSRRSARITLPLTLPRA
jgi:hypothetical protein